MGAVSVWVWDSWVKVVSVSVLLGVFGGGERREDRVEGGRVRRGKEGCKCASGKSDVIARNGV